MRTRKRKERKYLAKEGEEKREGKGEKYLEEENIWVTVERKNGEGK